MWLVILIVKLIHDDPHKLLLTNRKISRLRKALADTLSANVKLSKAHLSKIRQSGGFLGRLLESLLKTDFPSMKNVLKTLARSVFNTIR